MTVRGWAVWVFASGVIAAVGCTPRRPCSGSEPCPAPELYVCLPDPTGETAYCQARCDPSVDGTICNDGAVCLPYGSGSSCYPGGGRGLGSMCTSHYDCVRGAVCVRYGSDPAECIAGCDLEGFTGSMRTCPTGQHCEPAYSSAGGLCVPDF